MKNVVFLCTALAAGALLAQGRDAYAMQQVHSELQRVLGQVNVLQSNIDDISERLSRLERPNGSSDVAALKSQIAALESTVARLRTEMQSQRGEIVRDLSSRIAKMPQAQPSTKAPARTVTTTIGPHREYTVVAGDTLSIIASAFNTTVAKIKEMNGLKSDALRIGQKVKVPLKD